MPPPKRKCRLRGSRLSRWSRNASLSGSQSRRISTGNVSTSFTIDLADLSSALHPKLMSCVATWISIRSIRDRAKFQQSFPEHLALGAGVKRLPVILQRIGRVDMNAKHAGLCPIHQLDQVLPICLWLA